ncbi:MAG: 2-succinyl-5-enolpyruvyl-6-hydroxy-3-cyclohexene-1-carboxylic-acid synthase [Lentimicrobiaceae bacterium]|nr:2-succinyl-5-enolpyruvyl-6-hydroxy-3-cyclohexene-1-carboxylic-acid synthase [Lentimicrobiaceae bacterium]MCO5265232.1 2-succinyl-5-enolpyruvyl-6-hydroxy-3-cyclohexene-1-carboxylic-acid synthase [Lentimicrobium sp.]HPG32652.1 2-succinyl-5-enolpyruvyl-6-hydroxy-3-cyclohexene-1-carboxylic-acid synthase [Lentimicrobium sp.]
MSKEKEQISLLAVLMAEKGISNIVVSPGSRNAPAIIMLAQHQKLNLISIADERSAGFFALGIALKSQKPVALLCTSGSAALNYAPAIAEAYYQKVPLLVITADRPVEWIDQGDGQTIRQERIFANYIRKSFNLPVSTEKPENIWFATRIINEAIDRCLFPAAGPVHINLPLAEPLYQIDASSYLTQAAIISMAGIESKLPAKQLAVVAETWNNAASKLILVGQLQPSELLQDSLNHLANDPSVIVLTETTSNLSNQGFIACIDQVIDGLNETEKAQIKPEILLTFGGAVVSKKVKALLRKLKPAAHWHISNDPEEFYQDTYQSLSLHIPVSAESFLTQLSANTQQKESPYRERWNSLKLIRNKKHLQYINSLDFCDMQVFDMLFKHIPAGTDIHLANSTPVRYAQLFEHKNKYCFFANRGTSGIDGCVSTAAGAAYVADKPVSVITGDIGFFYDSNALWNQNLNTCFRIIIINNGGGNIFRIIDGPSDYDQLETFIETAHQHTAEGLAHNFGLRYFKADSQSSLSLALNEFYNYNNAGAAMLEIITPNILSAKVLKDYFKYMHT